MWRTAVAVFGCSLFFGIIVCVFLEILRKNRISIDMGVANFGGVLSK
jgi:hypothetical protein